MSYYLSPNEHSIYDEHSICDKESIFYIEILKIYFLKFRQKLSKIKSIQTFLNSKANMRNLTINF